MNADHDIDWGRYDDEQLIGHYLIASMDGRLSDQGLLGEQLIRRRHLSESRHHQHMAAARERPPLPRPIIAGPQDTELADWDVNRKQP